MFLVDIICTSGCLASSESPKSASSGNFVDSFRPYSSSARLVPVIVCGVERYVRRYLFNSDLQSFFLAWAALIAFNSERFCLSTSPFALGHRGVISLRLIPISEDTHPFLRKPSSLHCRSLDYGALHISKTVYLST